jgi:hypothetical protein
MNITSRIDRLTSTPMLRKILFLVGIGWLFDACDQGMNDIANASGSIDQSAMTNETHTIFQTMVYSRSIHVLAMLLLGFGFLMVFVRGHEPAGYIQLYRVAYHQ